MGFWGLSAINMALLAELSRSFASLKTGKNFGRSLLRFLYSPAVLEFRAQSGDAFRAGARCAYLACVLTGFSYVPF
jgi:hypothetical protein